MNKLYKKYFFTICLMLGLGVCGINAQETTPQKPVEEAEKIKELEANKEERAKEWSNNIEINLSSIDWTELDKKLSKTFEKITKKLEESSSTLNETLIKLHKDLNLSEGNIHLKTKIPNIEIEINNTKTDSENAIIKTKKLTKSYPANNDDLLLIRNSYGRILVNTWDKNEVKVDVDIKVTADNEDKANKLLEAVNISNGKTGNQISFRTEINKEENKNNWLTSNFWSRSSSSGHTKTEVYYTVYMPAKMAINFKTNYTNIELPNLAGNVTLAMNYGDLRGNNLTGTVNVRTNYTKIQLVNTNDVTLSANYGSVRMENVSGLNGNVNYCDIYLGSLGGTSILKMNYKNLKINKLASDFKTLNINSNYTNVILGFEGNSSFNFDVRTTYGNFSYGNNVAITEKTPAEGEKSYSTSKSYKGYCGKSPQGNVVIKSNYGGIKFL
jgi:hypothetical protein